MKKIPGHIGGGEEEGSARKKRVLPAEQKIAFRPKIGQDAGQPPKYWDGPNFIRTSGHLKLPAPYHIKPSTRRLVCHLQKECWRLSALTNPIEHCKESSPPQNPTTTNTRRLKENCQLTLIAPSGPGWGQNLFTGQNPNQTPTALPTGLELASSSRKTSVTKGKTIETRTTRLSATKAN